MHLSIDAEMNVHAIRVTTTGVSDSEGMGAVLPADLLVNRVIADSAYYSIERTEALSRAGVTPVIPPPAHAVMHGGEDTRLHDEIVKYIQDKGIYAFHKKYGYGLRAPVEAQISRIKRCIGATLLTQKIASQECEGVIIANLINLWIAFGEPVCVKNASYVRSTGNSYPSEQSLVQYCLPIARAKGRSQLRLPVARRRGEESRPRCLRARHCADSDSPRSRCEIARSPATQGGCPRRQMRTTV
jgi:hypothetical protein